MQTNTLNNELTIAPVPEVSDGTQALTSIYPPLIRDFDELEQDLPGSAGTLTDSQTRILQQAGITLRSAKDILATRYDHKPHVVLDYIARRSTTLFTGEAAVGKSLAVLDMAIAVATGTKWLGKTCERGTVLILDMENDEEIDLQPRLRKLYAARGIIGDIPLYIPRLGKGLALTSEACRSAVRALIEHYQPKLVILDPLVSSLAGANEDNSVDMRGIFDSLKAMAQDYDCALVVLHHPRKRSENNDVGQQIRGSSDIRNAVHGHLAIRDNRGVKTLIHDKCRSGPKQPNLTYEIRDDGTAIYVLPIIADAKPIIKTVVSDKEKLLGVLPADKPIKKAEIVNALGWHKDRVGHALNTLKAEGKVTSPKYGHYQLTEL